MPFEVKVDQVLESVKLIHLGYFEDDRGWFSEFFKSSDFENNDMPKSFNQINRSFSKKIGTIRGLHLQIPPMEQGKFVCCTRGSIFDVAVDVRNGSETFGKWISYELSDSNRRALWVPGGFAHGFQTLEENTEVIYLTTNEYAPEFERNISWQDPEIGIKWPVKDPFLSHRDGLAPTLSEAILRQ